VKRSVPLDSVLLVGPEESGVVAASQENLVLA